MAITTSAVSVRTHNLKKSELFAGPGFSGFALAASSPLRILPGIVAEAATT
jgi:hypothetical protein